MQAMLGCFDPCRLGSVLAVATGQPEYPAVTDSWAGSVCGTLRVVSRSQNKQDAA